ncbi:MAG TPA: C-GCAxxG-C-C family protein [Candidatus Acidoferrales bacterium]|nr:C-GCAxxG-C-C family protein [Candidatus Acidoferrales bacterium]
MEKKINRRELVTLVGGVAAAGLASSLVSAADHSSAASSTGIPWPYKPLDPDAVGQRAYESYLKGHCMYGPFEAIVGTLADKYGAPYKDFPSAMFKYGAGGVNGWATLCGSLNGSAAAIQLLSPDPSPLIDSLMSWYQIEALPNFYPKGAKFPEVRSVAGTPLCHESIAHWTKAAKRKAYSPERAERCGTLTASVARKTVQLLNDQSAGKALTGFTASKQTQGCMGCHEKGGVVENIRTKMDCGGCHTEQFKGGHPKM